MQTVIVDSTLDPRNVCVRVTADGRGIVTRPRQHDRAIETLPKLRLAHALMIADGLAGQLGTDITCMAYDSQARRISVIPS